MDRRALDYVLKQIGRCGGPSGFELELWNGVGIGDDTKTVGIRVYDVGSIGSRAPSVEEGLGDVLTQLLTKLGQHPKHRCPICLQTHDGFDLSTVPVEAFGDLMQELAEIGTEMSRCKNVGVGRHKGPTFSVELSTIGPPRAELYFTDLEERYADHRGCDRIFFEGSGKNVLDALEEAIAQARDHLVRRRPHRCPICGLFHARRVPK